MVLSETKGAEMIVNEGGGMGVFFFIGPFCNHPARSQCAGQAKTKSRATLLGIILFVKK